MRPMNVEQLKGLRVAMFDIETTDLDARYGRIICACLKDVGGATWTVRTDDPRNKQPFNDKWLVQELLKKMQEYDMFITYNGTMFDWRFLSTRHYVRNVKQKPFKRFHRDLLYHARSKFRVMGRAQKRIYDDLFGQGTSNKTFRTPDMADRVKRNDKRAIDWEIKHCKIDVKELEDIYLTFLPYLSDSIKRRTIP
jgi:uncharacterized protein YprB with RNaseH-like and TPR domain